MSIVKIISKENIKDLKFTSKEVLLDKESREKRMRNLLRGLALGNVLHGKVKITFETEDAKLYLVDTTIWAVSQEFINLKGNITIPVNAILGLDLKY
ncbi:hypothetical protein QWY93_01715 [Echinicola jeungdonensis]|uniref:Uncharacterized protein n=1 Tax=Echinicola jeungdonensis TaxID=709343 RepID=A0ABV5J649_9BACT|nr:hypothetical protein [Echinicola jeungdonensis]MDN3668053.1 hypothetical protein [Echinicola jeungdonensis]